ADGPDPVAGGPDRAVHRADRGGDGPFRPRGGAAADDPGGRRPGGGGDPRGGRGGHEPGPDGGAPQLLGGAVPGPAAARPGPGERADDQGEPVAADAVGAGGVVGEPERGDGVPGTVPAVVPAAGPQEGDRGGRPQGADGDLSGAEGSWGLPGAVQTQPGRLSAQGPTRIF